VYEQEADLMADAVMGKPEPQAAYIREPHIQRACPMCEEEELRRQPVEEKEELQRQPIEEEELQAKPTSGHITEVQPDIKSHIQSIRESVQTLSENDRAIFEP
jgi:hypothetical protein